MQHKEKGKLLLFSRHLEINAKTWIVDKKVYRGITVKLTGIILSECFGIFIETVDEQIKFPIYDFLTRFDFMLSKNKSLSCLY